jgi:hypothetical protein
MHASVYNKHHFFETCMYLTDLCSKKVTCTHLFFITECHTIETNPLSFYQPVDKHQDTIQPSTKVVINNPKFWTIPLRCFMGCKQEDLTKGLFLWESSRDLKSKMKNVHRFGVFI